MHIFTVYAHPDDESFGPAAVLAHYVKQGAEVDGLWFTRGEHGQAAQEPPPAREQLARSREQDLREVANLIGYASVMILDFEDGTLDRFPDAFLESRVLGHLRQHAPDVVLTFGPAGITRHADHRAVHRATLAAFHHAREEGIALQALFYDAVGADAAKRLGIESEADGQPNTHIDVRDTQRIKRDALAIHARHVADAAERLKRLEQHPLPVETLHRAWPAVEPGITLDALLP